MVVIDAQMNSSCLATSSALSDIDIQRRVRSQGVVSKASCSRINVHDAMIFGDLIPLMRGVLIWCQVMCVQMWCFAVRSECSLSVVRGLKSEIKENCSPFRMLPARKSSEVAGPRGGVFGARTYH